MNHSATLHALIFSAPSGSGKTTLINYLLSLMPELTFSISATTRAPRPGETEGKEYYFLTPEVFKQKVEAGEFVEYEYVYGDVMYGTLWSEMERINQNRGIPIFDVDVKGALSLKNKLGKRAYSIFIAPPSIEELERRLDLRNTDAKSIMQSRLQFAQSEIDKQDEFDQVVVNDDLAEAKREIYSLAQKFLHSFHSS